MNFISHGNIYDSYFVKYDYKENLTLVVTLQFEARENKQEFHTSYCNSIVDRKIEVSEAIVAGVDYVESIVDELFTEEPSAHPFWPCPAQSLLTQVQSLQKGKVKTADVERAREELRVLMTAIRAALDHNDRWGG